MNVRFLSQLEVLHLREGMRKLLAPFRVELGTDVLAVNKVAGAEGTRLIVPKGYETDFASVPRLPFAFWLTGDTAHKSAVVHDWLYEQRAPRELADEIFFAAMKAEGVPAWRRAIMWAGVRVGGATRYSDRAPAATMPEPPASSGP